MTTTKRSSSLVTLPSAPKVHGHGVRRPRTAPDLFRRTEKNGPSGQQQQQQRKMTRLLLNVTVERSLGPVQVVLSPESKVADLIKAAVEAYLKEGRRPLLDRPQPEAYELHYSKFSLECLDPQEEVINLGSRNFFLCSKEVAAAAGCCRRDERRIPSDTLMSRPSFLDFFLRLRS